MTATGAVGTCSDAARSMARRILTNGGCATPLGNGPPAQRATRLWQTTKAAINFRPAGWYLSSNFSQQQAQRPFDLILRRLGHPACVSLTCHTWRLWLVCVEARRYILFPSAYETALDVLWFRALVHLGFWALLNFSKLTKGGRRLLLACAFLMANPY
jgi:hypothetical protein